MNFNRSYYIFTSFLFAFALYIFQSGMAYAGAAPPVITCPPDTMLQCPASTDPSNTGMATCEDDNDPNPVVNFTDQGDSPLCPGTITRIWKCTNTNGDSDECDQVITLVKEPIGCCQHPAEMGPPSCNSPQTEAQCTDAGGGWCQGGTCKSIPHTPVSICQCPADHTKCYDVKDDLLVRGTHELKSPEFPDLDPEKCRIIGKDRYFCTPVCKDLPEDAICGLSQVDSLGGPGLTDQICYWINCRGEVPEDTYVQDQFNNPDEPRLLENFGPTQRLCAPAVKCDPDCVHNGEGEACTAPGEKPGVCEDQCRCLQCGESGLQCCSDDACNAEDLVCDAGTCKECGGDQQLCCSGDTCDSGLTCDAGTCTECGGDQQLCCSGDMCDTPSLICQGGTCEQCGGDQQPCCEFNSCDESYVCDQGTCGPG